MCAWAVAEALGAAVLRGGCGRMAEPMLWCFGFVWLAVTRPGARRCRSRWHTALALARSMQDCASQRAAGPADGPSTSGRPAPASSSRRATAPLHRAERVSRNLSLQLRALQRALGGPPRPPRPPGTHQLGAVAVTAAGGSGLVQPEAGFRCGCSPAAAAGPSQHLSARVTLPARPAALSSHSITHVGLVPWAGSGLTRCCGARAERRSR
jgi:hypothetical protein